jgi:GNAT superfamily N-acetyltransferase
MHATAITVRKAERKDAEALATVFSSSWELAYRGIVPHTHLQVMLRQRDAAWWRHALTNSSGQTLVVEVAAEVGGYVNFGRSRWRLPQQGEIYELYLAPTFQGIGLGEHLFESARHALDMRRMSGLIVWALMENDAACRFYRRRGGRPVGKAFERMAGKLVPKIAYGWS